MNWRESNSQRPYIVNELETVKHYGEPGERVHTCLVLKAFVWICGGAAYMSNVRMFALVSRLNDRLFGEDNRERSNPPTKKRRTFVCKPLK